MRLSIDQALVLAFWSPLINVIEPARISYDRAIISRRRVYLLEPFLLVRLVGTTNEMRGR